MRRRRCSPIRPATTSRPARRRAGSATAIPTIAPYETFATADGDLALAVGNDGLWQRFCQAAELPDLAADPRFASNAGRLEHYAALKPRLDAAFAARSRADWTARLLAAGVPCGAVRTVEEVFADPQTAARQMVARVAHATLGEVSVTGVPVKLSDTPASVRLGPPVLGQHTAAVARAGIRSGGHRRASRRLAPYAAVMDIALLRKSLLQAIEAAKRDAVERRVRADEASQRYEKFLEETATPVFRAMASALRGEGLLFDVIAPSGGVRLVPERTREDGIELTLDATVDPPQPIVRVMRTRGSRVTQHERPVAGPLRMEGLTDEHVAAMLLEELRPWLER